MSARREQRRRDRVRAVIEETTDGLEPITDHDLRIIKLALGDRVLDHRGGPPAIAAQKVLDKIARNEAKAASR